MRIIHEMDCEYCGMPTLCWQKPKNEYEPIMCVVCRIEREIETERIMKRAYQRAAELQIDKYNEEKRKLKYKEEDNDTHDEDVS